MTRLPIKSLLLEKEPNWIVSRPGEHHRIPLSAQSWIYEPGSITQRLRSYYGDAVKVKILLNCRRLPFLGERKRLKLNPGHYALTREVLLHADGIPLILARTLIPEKTVKAAQRNLAHLGSKPLGEVIFSNPKLTRLEMDFALIAPPFWTPLAVNEANIEQSLWARRTVYAIHHKPLLVNEFFLPEVLNLL